MRAQGTADRRFRRAWDEGTRPTGQGIAPNHPDPPGGPDGSWPPGTHSDCLALLAACESSRLCRSAAPYRLALRDCRQEPPARRKMEGLFIPKDRRSLWRRVLQEEWSLTAGLPLFLVEFRPAGARIAPTSAAAARRPARSASPRPKRARRWLRTSALSSCSLVPGYRKGDIPRSGSRATSTPRSLTPPPTTALDLEGSCCARVRRCRHCPTAVALTGGLSIHVVAP